MKLFKKCAEVSTTTTFPTATTVIAKFPSPDRLSDSHDPDQSLPSCKSPAEVAEAGEEYFSFDRFVLENPHLSLAATVEDKQYDPLDPGQPLPSIPSQESSTVEVTGTGEEYFSFDKFIQQNPNLSWAATFEDQRHDVHEPEEPLQFLPPYESPTVEDPEEEYFSFDKFIQDHPNLSWAAVHVEGEGGGEEEPVTAAMPPSAPPARHSTQAAVTQDSGEEEGVATTMSPSYPPARHSSQAAVTPNSDRSSSSDSLMRALLQPPPSMRAAEPITRTSPSHSEASAAEESFPFQQQQLSGIAFLGSSLLAEETASPLRRSKRRRSEHGSSSASEDICTPPRLIDTGLGDLDAKSALFLARRLSPPVMRKPLVQQQQQHSTAIDPYAVGLATVNDVLRDGAMLTKELQRDAREIGWPQHKEPCVCDITRHPSWWTVDHIKDVHDYSFLLDCQDIKLNRYSEVAANSTKTIVVYDVPMAYNNPVKLKAEQVLRFVDVEVGYGDQTCDDLFFYVQPSDRKVLMVVSHRRVVGIVVAEEITFAHRILWETVGFMELEEDPVPVRIGINRLWVHISMRRRHLASILCQLIGNRFYENERLHIEDFAFNNISDAMVMFAKVFLKTLRPPLYFRLR